MLSFRLAGINNQNFIMEDRETGSWWQQVSGEAIHGPLEGERLTRVFHDELTFKRWISEAPGGRVLVPAADTAWKHFSADWETKTAKEPVNVYAPLDPQLPPRAVIVGVEHGAAAKAYPVDRVLAQSPLHDRVGGVPIVLLVGEDGASIRAFQARRDSAAIELVRKAGAPPGEFVDVGTGSRWNSRGEAVAGPLAGTRLRPVYVLKDYWFDWKTYHPATGVYLLGGTMELGN